MRFHAHPPSALRSPFVVAGTLTEVADELYGLPPAEFTAARDEQARAARTAGRRDDAAAIRKLARPTTSAWLVNQLTRHEARQLGRLFDLGEALQEAQRTLAGDRMRELSTRRRQVVSDLRQVAAELAERAGQPASPAVLDEVRATLEAALADAQAREAVRSGRLTKALAYAGLGEVDLTAALALPDLRRPAAGARTGRQPRAGRPPGRSAAAASATAPESDAAARAAAATADAETAAEAAAAAVAAAEGDLAAIAEQRQFLRRRITHLEGELAQARAEDTRLSDDARQADQAKADATRELKAARRQVDKARKRAPGPG
jgi:DNA repair exonuclease SbcCD ATPase subunit